MTNMVNMQVLVQKVTDVARIQNDQQQTSISRQAEFSQQILDQTAKMANTVSEPNKNEKPHIQDKPEKEKQEKEKKKRHAQTAQAKKQKDANTILTQTTPNRIDITI